MNEKQTETEVIEVACYGRNSSDKQTTSQDIQADAFELFLGNDFVRLFGKPAKVVAQYKDHGKSASAKKRRKHKERDDFIRMLQDIEQGKVKVIIVLNTSRFSRLHPLDTSKLHGYLYEYNAKLVTIEDSKIWDYNNFGDLLQLFIKAEQDHQYIRTFAANSLRGRIHGIKAGGTNCVHAPYGLTKMFVSPTGEQRIINRTESFICPEKWKVYSIAGDELEQQVAKWAFDRYANNDVSLCQVSRELNTHENEIVRLGPNGKGWVDNVLREMYKNKKYIGIETLGSRCLGEHWRVNGDGLTEVRKDGEISKVLEKKSLYNQGIIELVTFARVQKKLAKNKTNKPLRSGQYALSGILYCGECGRSLCPHPNNGNPKYFCQSGIRSPGICKCHTWSVSQADMLPLILDQIDQNILSALEDKPDAIDIETISNIESEVAELATKIEAIKCKIRTASIDVSIALSDAMSGLVDRQAALLKMIGRSNQEASKLASVEEWEQFVRPCLIAQITGNKIAPVGMEGLQSEVDRLYNTSLIRPSDLRNKLLDLDVKVSLWWKDETKHPGQGKRHTWGVDYGRIQARIGNQDITGIRSLNPHGSDTRYLIIDSKFTQFDILTCRQRQASLTKEAA